MKDCIFCKIIAGEIPSKKVYEDDKMLAFHDINPAAPVHIICVPKIHMDSLNNINDINQSQDNINYVSHILGKIPEIAKTLGVFEGYRVITNIGDDGGQSVKHLHFHIIGGRKLGYLG